MSRTYSSWRSLSSPNIRSSSTSEKPITAFSGVRSSCDMLARNSDLWPEAISSAREVWTLWIAIAPWVAKVSTSAIVRAAERRDRRLPEHDHAEHAVLAQHRDAEHRAEAAELERARHRVLRVVAGVADLHRLALGADAADDRARAGLQRHAHDVVAVGLRGAERVRAAVDVPVEDVDQPGVGAAEPHRLLEHGLEHRLELERRAPEHLEHAVGGGLALERLREVLFKLGSPVLGHGLNLSHRPASTPRRCVVRSARSASSGRSPSRSSRSSPCRR